MVKVAGHTHVGKRINNEDSFVVGNNFAIVADGMGGHSKGEIASKMAVMYISDFLKNESNVDKEAIIRIVSESNNLIFRKSEEDKSMNGMGTTVVLCYWNGYDVVVSNVGDSRCYLCSDGIVKQVTVDHSYVQSLVDSGKITQQEAENRPDKNIIMRAIGTDEKVDVDIFELKVKTGDILVLCSDGLSGEVGSDDIYKIITKKCSVNKLSKMLVDEAVNNGGTDNITAVVIKFE